MKFTPEQARELLALPWKLFETSTGRLLAERDGETCKLSLELPGTTEEHYQEMGCVLFEAHKELVERANQTVFACPRCEREFSTSAECRNHVRECR